MCLFSILFVMCSAKISLERKYVILHHLIVAVFQKSFCNVLFLSICSSRPTIVCESSRCDSFQEQDQATCQWLRATHAYSNSQPQELFFVSEGNSDAVEMNNWIGFFSNA